MLDDLSPEWRRTVEFYLLPLRHVAWGANMNCAAICDAGYGTAVTAPSMFAAGDHLAIAQIISRIGLLLDGNSGLLLDAAKRDWLNARAWQDLRQLVENSFVLGDWFELFVVQNLVIDGLLYPLVYRHFDRFGQTKGAAALSLLCEFMSEWFAEQSRWVDAVIKGAASESAGNAALLSRWFVDWKRRGTMALAPLSVAVLGEAAGTQAINIVQADLTTRATALGLVL
jgi:phenol hydroxylase P1 protein